VAGGRVVALGARATAVRAARGAERIDCRARTILPGLIDPHLHLFALAARDAEIDCAGFGRSRDLVRAVADVAAVLAPGAWVRGAGLDDARLDRLPTAAELDRAAPRNPVRLRHRSRHASLLNGRGLALLPATEPAIARGGRTGLVAGAEEVVSRAVGPLPTAVIEAGLVRVGRELAALGLTTVADATPHTWAELAPLRSVMARGLFPLRVVAMRRLGARAWRSGGRLMPGPVKLLVDEGPDGLRPTARDLARRIARAARSGAQVAVHCVGVATLVAVLDAMAALPPRLRRNRRHRLEHLSECPPPLVRTIADLDLSVVTNPAFVYWRGDVYRAETSGPARRWLYRARSLRAAGIPLAGASDAPVVAPSPWIGMAAAQKRRTATGVSLGPDERLDAAEALSLFTTGAARALRADRLGRLVLGGPADLVVVDDDPMYGPVEGDTRAWLTMIDGEIAWRE
jgi:predicted amidohydrolase YtcJ